MTTVRVEGPAYQVAVDMSLNYWSEGNKKSFIGTDEDPYFASRVGALGETAVAQLLDLEIDDGTSWGRYDLLWNDKDSKPCKVEVKCAKEKSKYNSALVAATQYKAPHGPKPLYSDIFIFAYLHFEDREAGYADINIIGVTKKDDILELTPVMTRHGHSNYQIKHADLYDISVMTDGNNPQTAHSLPRKEIKPKQTYFHPAMINVGKL